MNNLIKMIDEIEEQHEKDNERYFESLANGQPDKLPSFVISYGDKSVSFPTELADIYEGFIHCLHTMRDCCENLEEN